MKIHQPERVVCAALKRFIGNGGRFIMGEHEDQKALIYILVSNLENAEIPEHTAECLSQDLAVMRGKVIDICKL